MDFRDIKFKYFHFDKLASTNIRAHELVKSGQIRSNAIISTNFQSQGKGQRGSRWESEEGKNLLLSIVWLEDYPISKAQIFNKMIAVCIFKLIDKLTARETKIKWPNDILVDKKKICGILIENSIQSSVVSQSIIGIGINVNQLKFQEYPRQAVSLASINNEVSDLEKLKDDLISSFLEQMNIFYSDPIQIEKEYHSHLYGINESMQFLIGSETTDATIKSVDQNGQLVLEIKGEEKLFSERELRFIA